MEEFKRNYNKEQFDFIMDNKLSTLLNKKSHFCIKTVDGGYFLNFYYLDVKNEKTLGEQVYFYYNTNKLLMACDNLHCKKMMEEISEQDTPVSQIITFITNLILDDIEVFDNLEEQITMLEDRLLESKKVMNSAVADIVEIRRKLLKMKQYYEQLDTVMDMFIEMINDEGSREVEHKYSIFIRRLEQYLNSVQNLRELVMQAREIYQSKIDMEQNNLMKIFTVITTIFTPLTLITGWYGMNFINMPELQWQYGYLYVISLGVIVSCISIIIFKLKKWF